MRYFVSFLVIAFSISALLGGFMSGRAAVPHFPTASVATPAPQSTLSPQLLREPALMDEVAHDEFARDAAVVLPPSGADVRDDASLALVIVDAGHSGALETPFLSLNVPVTLVINPAGTDATAIYQLARERGDAVYVQLNEPVSAPLLHELQRRFPEMTGVAMRLAQDAQAGDVAALRAARLAFFDEYGEDDALPARFRAAGVRYAARGITVDDHAQRSYVAYMLRQAVHLARRRTAVVMARPFPGTLQAFQYLLARASREGVRIEALPERLSSPSMQAHAR